VRNQEQLDRFLAWLDEFYGFFRDEAGGRPTIWREIRHPSATAIERAG
jgi:hypothetical protein